MVAAKCREKGSELHGTKVALKFQGNSTGFSFFLFPFLFFLLSSFFFLLSSFFFLLSSFFFRLSSFFLHLLITFPHRKRKKNEFR